MKLFAASFIMLLSSQAFSICETKHPLECVIRTLQPAIKPEEARTLSNLIYKFSAKHNVDPYRVIAIGMQESSLRNIDRVNNRGIITDVGIFQFNTLTIDAYNIDMVRLKIDIAYQVERMCWLLSKKLVYCKDLNDAWSCWHSKTPVLRDKYILMVNKYYKKPFNMLLTEEN